MTHRQRREGPIQVADTVRPNLAARATAVALALSKRHNRNTRDLWDSMAQHRMRFTREILRLTGAGSVCLLGAGNCNDIELHELAARFEAVHLVDIDRDALEAGVERQRLGHLRERLQLHAGVDLAGFSELPLEHPVDLQRLVRYFAEYGETARERSALPVCDIVVSCCVLSQLIESLTSILGPQEPALPKAILAMRNAHLEFLSALTRRGGSVLFISDMVSSETAPELLTWPEFGLARLRDDLLRRRDFFHGLNPYRLEQALAMSSARVQKVERRPPWRWWIGERAFLVVALRAERGDSG